MNLSPEEFHVLKALHNNETSASNDLGLIHQRESLIDKGFIHFDMLSNKCFLTIEGNAAVKEGQLKSVQSNNPNSKGTEIANIMLDIVNHNTGWNPEQMQEFAEIIVKHQGVKDE